MHYNSFLVAKSCSTLCDPIDCSPSGFLCHVRFPRQEYYSGLPFIFPGNLPDSGIKCTYLSLAGRFFTTEPPGKPIFIINKYLL